MPDAHSAHAGHDTLLLAAAVDHDPDPETVAAIERLTAECPDCAAIVADLRLLATGLADLPTELPAPRDFRITDVQAERLRRGGFLRRLLQPFGIDGLPGLQPLAGALTAVGLAGILLSSLPLGFGAAGAAPLADSAASGTTGQSRSYASSTNAPEAQVPAPASSQLDAAAPGGKTGSPVPQSVGGAAPDASSGNGGGLSVDRNGAAPPAGTPAFKLAAPADRIATALASVPPLTLVSAFLLVLGVGLLSLRLVARRID